MHTIRPVGLFLTPAEVVGQFLQLDDVIGVCFVKDPLLKCADVAGREVEALGDPGIRMALQEIVKDFGFPGRKG